MAQIDVPLSYRFAVVDHLVRLRTDAGLSQRAVASAFGLRVGAIRRVEHLGNPRMEPVAVASYAAVHDGAASTILELLPASCRAAVAAELTTRAIRVAALGPDRIPVRGADGLDMGRTLAEERQLRSISLPSIATAAGTRVAQVYAFEAGVDPTPPFTVVAAYLRTLGFDVDDVGLPLRYLETALRVQDQSGRPRPRLLPAAVGFRRDLAAGLRLGLSRRNLDRRAVLDAAQVPSRIYQQLMDTRDFSGPVTVGAVARLAVLADADLRTLDWPDPDTARNVALAGQAWARSRARSAIGRDARGPTRDITPRGGSVDAVLDTALDTAAGGVTGSRPPTSGGLTR